MAKRSAPPWGLIVVALCAVLFFGTCVAICGDDDNQGSLGLKGGATTQSHRQRGDDRRKDGSNHKCEGADQCQDNDLSPSFDNSPIYLCLPNSRCDFGDSEEAVALPDPRCVPYHCDPKPQSLMPPDPAKLIDAIRVMTQGTGEAAGALAGAIAGGTIGILL